MKKIYPLIFISALFSINLFSQIVIDDSDMPQPGDTIRLSTTVILPGFDYESTGQNYTWDFSFADFQAQVVDTFVEVTSTPIVYQLVFNNNFLYPNHKATVARKLASLEFIPGFAVTEPYTFYKNSDADYREVGFGATLNGIPIPVPYEEIDVMYRFPINYGDVDSSQASYEIDIPNLGYYGSSKNRKNIVDGWGTLITPYGSFQTLRIKTTINQFDSLYVDSLNIGFPLNREIIEYKWLGKGFGHPLFQVNEEGFIVTATYIDSLRSPLSMDEDYITQELSMKIFPNPCSEYVSVSYELIEESEVQLSLFSLYGKKIKEVVNKLQDRGIYSKMIYLKEEGITPGIYILRLTVNGMPSVRRIIVS